jgi:hypothetical protein
MHMRTDEDASRSNDIHRRGGAETPVFTHRGGHRAQSSATSFQGNPARTAPRWCSSVLMRPSSSRYGEWDRAESGSSALQSRPESAVWAGWLASHRPGISGSTTIIYGALHGGLGYAHKVEMSEADRRAPTSGWTTACRLSVGRSAHVGAVEIVVENITGLPLTLCREDPHADPSGSVATRRSR